MSKQEKINQELVNEASNELALKGSEQGLLLAEDQSQKYYSIVPQNRKEAVAVFNAINNPNHRVADYINKEIEVAHVLIETVELVNEKTGELEQVPRTVFLDTKGESYVAVSFGVFNSTKRIIAMFGEPASWTEPVKIEVKQIKKGENSILTLNIIG